MIERLLARLPRGARAVAWLGILTGLLAFWVELPPLATKWDWIRTPVVPSVIGLVAIALGAYAISRGVRRLGWSAVVAGVGGIGLGYLATRSGPRPPAGPIS